jgi:hypothetical protein
MIICVFFLSPGDSVESPQLYVATPLYVHAGVRVQISYFPLFHFKGKTLATKLFAQKKKLSQN